MPRKTSAAEKSLIEAIREYHLFEKVPEHEFTRLRPGQIKPPFDRALVERAIRHYMAHHRPWLPLARSEDTYDSIWTAEPIEGGYRIRQGAPDEDPYAALDAWIGAVCETTEAVLKGERPLLPSDDSMVSELVERCIESFEEEIDYYLEHPEETPVPAEVLQDWDELDPAQRFEWITAHYAAHPEGLDYLSEYVTESPAHCMPAELDPDWGPAEALGAGPIEFPIGWVNVVLDAGIHGDATEVVVKPRLALTFLQVWLDDNEKGVRILLAG
ncbi:hypothetical protein QVG61_07225 [Thiohalobacter sp. IOR34]|uniref:hypothetical protein n=1 Tax=Thiohalobacter sp. IOR34 TaxID=3057176 RepID=UPI0025B0EE7A|nr:hypothetical protein [Thiohalobacter sp. IOR34]WJW74314.1 hypothetical protein QVG61_07225 [Thiohalobacter sp. IOR34]